jgi:hypothetical protein
MVVREDDEISNYTWATGIKPGLSGNIGPIVTTWRGVILYCRVGEGESKEPRERSRRGRGLNTPQWDSA